MSTTTTLRGVGIGLGVAQGPVARMAAPLPAPADAPSTLGPDAETARVQEAIGVVARELEARGAQAGGSARDVLEAQAMMAEDPTLEAEVATRITAGKTAEFAVYDAFASFRDQLTAVGGYLGERAADLDDVAQRVIARLRGVAAPGVPEPGHPYVLVATDLAPADTALLDLDQVLALVTSEGGPTSHTAILAREKGIVRRRRLDRCARMKRAQRAIRRAPGRGEFLAGRPIDNWFIERHKIARSRQDRRCEIGRGRASGLNLRFVIGRDETRTRNVMGTKPAPEKGVRV